MMESKRKIVKKREILADLNLPVLRKTKGHREDVLLELGYSPMAKIPASCGLRASSTYFGWGMRTHSLRYAQQQSSKSSVH